MLALVASMTAAFGAPMTIQHQGRVLDASGLPVSGDIPVSLALYDAESGGTLLWSGSWADVALVGGYYTVTLGVAPSPALDTSVFDHAEVWLAASHGGTVVPRQRLSSTPYAIEAERAQLTAKQVVTPAPSNTTHGWAGTDLAIPSRLVAFTKRRDDTALLLTWHDNMRCTPDSDSSESNCRVQVRFKRPADATWRDCGTPGPMLLDFYSNSQNVHWPTTFLGTCTELSDGTPLASGSWQLQPFVTQNPHNGGADGQFAIGWVSTRPVFTFEEVE